MIKRVVAYSLFGLGFLTVTFFRHYSGNIIPYPFLFWILGSIMFGAGLIVLRFEYANQDNRNRNRVLGTINDLKRNGEKLIVDFSQCQVKENNYFKEQKNYGPENEMLTLGVKREIEMLNALGGGNYRNTKQVEVKQTVIVYSQKNPKTGQTEIFKSRVIDKDQTTLEFYLDRQKKTSLYVDRNDRSKYYFDLDFLNS